MRRLYSLLLVTITAALVVILSALFAYLETVFSR